MKRRTKMLCAFGTSTALVTVCAVLAYTSAVGADAARVLLLPTLFADIAMNGVHASGGIANQALALAASIVAYGFLFWVMLEVVVRKKKPNQSLQPTGPSARG